MIEPKLLADGWMELRVINDVTGELEGIMELKPTYHAFYAAKLSEAQSQIRALESSPSRGGKVLLFRKIAMALLFLLAV
jgi:hypothetical protein